MEKQNDFGKGESFSNELSLLMKKYNVTRAVADFHLMIDEDTICKSTLIFGHDSNTLSLDLAQLILQAHNDYSEQALGFVELLKAIIPAEFIKKEMNNAIRERKNVSDLIPHEK